MGTFECKEFESTEIIRISPEGEVCINWPVVEQHAAKWQKGCTDVHIGYSLALIAARGGDE